MFLPRSLMEVSNVEADQRKARAGEQEDAYASTVASFLSQPQGRNTGVGAAHQGAEGDRDAATADDDAAEGMDAAPRRVLLQSRPATAAAGGEEAQSGGEDGGGGGARGEGEGEGGEGDSGDEDGDESDGEWSEEAEPSLVGRLPDNDDDRKKVKAAKKEAAKKAKVSGWGVYCHDFRRLPVAPSVSCPWVDPRITLRGTDFHRLPPSPAVSQRLQPI